jgi:hypothetical protein
MTMVTNERRLRAPPQSLRGPNSTMAVRCRQIAKALHALRDENPGVLAYQDTTRTYETLDRALQAMIQQLRERYGPRT